MHFEKSKDFALSLDLKYDALHQFRRRFYFPQHQDKDVLYFTGNSLGLQPRSAEEYLMQEIRDWRKYGVEGHFMAQNPWFSYHEPFAALLTPVTGALPSEVVVMGSLTNNLHLLMVSFYRPTQERYKIICEKKSFPSDQYALDSQVRFHGFAPVDAVVEISPRQGEEIIRPEDILEAIREHKDSLALVMMGGVNYYTGQLFDMAAITREAHAVGAVAGFDLAHAAGNVPLKLHEWNVDFAAWCSYKYMNSGPGAVAGIFVHERHHKEHLPRFEGWWGASADTRFLMNREFAPFYTAEAWQLSNAPVFNMAIHRASLEIFREAGGMEVLREKSLKLTGYMEFLIQEMNREHGAGLVTIITPSDPEQRGCQLSLVIEGRGKEVFNRITEKGVIADWREPNVIRVAPVPLYNSFEDVFQFVDILKDTLLNT